MKIKNKIVFISLILLILLSITCVSATQEADVNDTLTASESNIDEVSVSSDSEIQSAESNFTDSVKLSMSEDSQLGYSADDASLEASKSTPQLYTANRALYVKDAAQGYNYLIILKDNNGKALSGKSLSVNFNGKNYTATTDARGWASVKIAANTAGMYNVNVTFKGDKNYNLISKNSTIGLVKEPVYFVAPNRVLYIYEIYDGYTFPMIVKDKDGKTLANQIALVEFNGKRQAGYTDAKGWFYINITANNLGTFKVTLKSGENRYYRFATDSRTITIIMNHNNPYGKKAKKVWINADMGSDDMKKAVADLLRKQGWTVYVGQTYSNAHYTDYFKVTSDYQVYITLYNGFCAGTIREAYSSSIQNTLKQKGVVLVVMWDTRDWTNPQGMKPYRYGDFTGYDAARAWDDNFSTSDPSINNVASWLKSKNALYCANPTASGLVSQFLAGGYFAFSGK